MVCRVEIVLVRCFIDVKTILTFKTQDNKRFGMSINNKKPSSNRMKVLYVVDLSVRSEASAARGVMTGDFDHVAAFFGSDVFHIGGAGDAGLFVDDFV